VRKEAIPNAVAELGAQEHNADLYLSKLAALKQIAKTRNSNYKKI
jgi:hypothetical protein